MTSLLPFRTISMKAAATTIAYSKIWPLFYFDKQPKQHLSVFWVQYRTTKIKE